MLQHVLLGWRLCTEEARREAVSVAKCTTWGLIPAGRASQPAQVAALRGGGGRQPLLFSSMNCSHASVTPARHFRLILNAIL